MTQNGPAFVCTSTTLLNAPGADLPEAQRDALNELRSSPLALLLYLTRRINFDTGHSLDWYVYRHPVAAIDLGLSERTVRRHFQVLVTAGAVVPTRKRHGFSYVIPSRIPTSQADQDRTEVAVLTPARAVPDRPVVTAVPLEVPQGRTEVADQDRTEVAVSPAGASRIDSENLCQRITVGGGGMVVGGPPALAPPLSDPVVLKGTAKIAAVEHLLKQQGHPGSLGPFDKNKIMESGAAPEDIVACYDDIWAGRFGTDSQRRRVNVERAIEALPGWLSERAGIRSPKPAGRPAGAQDYIRAALEREPVHGAA